MRLGHVTLLIVLWNLVQLSSAGQPEAKGDKKPDELVLGVWHLPAAKMEKLRFNKDGTLHVTVLNKRTMKPFDITGQYKVIDDKTIEVALDPITAKEVELPVPLWFTLGLLESLFKRDGRKAKLAFRVSETELTIQKTKYGREEHDEKRVADEAKRTAREMRAESYLRYAKKLLDSGMTEKAESRLTEIVKDFGDTKAAAEAMRLLAGMTKK